MSEHGQSIGSTAAISRATLVTATLAGCISGVNAARAADSPINVADLLPGCALETIATGLTGATGMAIAPDNGHLAGPGHLCN
jgi:hypothetical protein